MSIATNKIIHQALAIVKPRFRLSLDHGYHGIKHWVRVWANAEMLCKYYDIDPTVPCWFAFLHDSCRENEDRDPDHGQRAADWAFNLLNQGELLISRKQFELLDEAMSDHSWAVTTEDLTIRVCWDADRLDLGRVGTRPDPARLCTKYARDPDVIQAAWERSRK